MARPMRGCPTARLQLEDDEEPETNPSVPHQEVQPDAAGGKVIADYNLDIDYEGSEPKNEPVAQEEKEENSNAEYENMEIPQARTFYQRMMPHDVIPVGILRVRT